MLWVACETAQALHCTKPLWPTWVALECNADAAAGGCSMHIALNRLEHVLSIGEAVLLNTSEMRPPSRWSEAFWACSGGTQCPAACIDPVKTCSWAGCTATGGCSDRLAALTRLATRHEQQRNAQQQQQRADHAIDPALARQQRAAHGWGGEKQRHHAEPDDVRHIGSSFL